MSARKAIARKDFWQSGVQHQQTVLQTGQSLELIGHSLELGGTFVRDLTFCEYLQWATACPE
jgi:hypothetical protein